MAWYNAIAHRLYWRIWFVIAGSMVVLGVGVGMAWYLSEQERLPRPAMHQVEVHDMRGVLVDSETVPMQRMPGGGLKFSIKTGADVQSRGIHTVTVWIKPRIRESNAWWEWLRPPYGFWGVLVMMGATMMGFVFPIARRLTRQLEALQQGVQRWGQGDLSVRFPESGQDEVADLAHHFNIAAEHIAVLIQAQKSLLANASHELRSPLARIRMAVELSGAQDDPASAAMRAEIRRNIGELDQLTGEILLASRLDAKPYDMGATEPMDMTGLLVEECALTGASLDVSPSAVPGALTCTAGLIVNGVPRLLRRAVRNLLENAFRYGKQAVGENKGVSARIERADNGDILIHVDDSGPGVPPDQRERIFEPFYRLPGASEREGGVGLGLALVRSIAQRHGGSITCGDREGGDGARFTLRLPCAAAAAPQMAA